MSTTVHVLVPGKGWVCDEEILVTLKDNTLTIGCRSWTLSCREEAVDMYFAACDIIGDRLSPDSSIIN